LCIFINSHNKHNFIKSQPKNLKRILGIGFGLAIIIGGTIGIGILRMPAIIASNTTNSVLFISFWIIGGIISLLGASIYAELGTRFAVAGGPFVYAQAAFGNTFGFITGWGNWIYLSCVIAYLSIAVAEYINQLTKAHLPLGVMSSVLIGLLAVIQWQGLRLSSNFQKIMSALKAIGLLILVAGCFTYFFNSNKNSQELIHTSPIRVPLFSSIVLSLRAIFVTYGGWNSAVYFAEEDKNPSKNLPRSLIWGVISIMIIYVLVNIGLIAVLPLQTMAKSLLPAADAAKLVFGGKGDFIVTIISVISLLGILNAVLLFTPRILFAISRAGLFFNSISNLNKYSIPGNALITTTLISALLASSGLFNVVVNMTALLIVLVDLSVYIFIIFIRKQKSGIVSPYKAWGYPYSAIIMIIITLGLAVGLFIEDSVNCIYSFFILALGIPIYFLNKKFSTRLGK
jgi:APA family basic amino acid/polyamine antiporter